jgi:hypothetical protein
MLRALASAHGLALWAGSYGHFRFQLMERSFEPPFGADSPWLAEHSDGSHRGIGSDGPEISELCQAVDDEADDGTEQFIQHARWYVLLCDSTPPPCDTACFADQVHQSNVEPAAVSADAAQRAVGDRAANHLDLVRDHQDAGAEELHRAGVPPADGRARLGIRIRASAVRLSLLAAVAAPAAGRGGLARYRAAATPAAALRARWR